MLCCSSSSGSSRIEQIRLPAVRAVPVDGPLGDPRPHHLARQLHLPGHLAEIAVAEHHHRVAVLEGELEREHGQVEHLLGRGRGEHDGVGVAVAEASAGELDVRLLGADVTQPGAAPHDVHEDGRHLCPDHVGDPLQHQAEAGGAREGHAALPGAAGAVHHVHGRHLADGLDEDPVKLGQYPCHQLRAFGRRRDRVPEDVAAAGQEGAQRRGVGPLDDERLPLGRGPPCVRPGLGPGRRKGSRARRHSRRDRRRPGRLQQVETVGLRAGIDAESAAIAVRQVQHHRDEPRLRVYLGARRSSS